MAREKFQTLTEQMFYILLCLRRPCCGADVMERARTMTEGRVLIGPGTLYALLETFRDQGWTQELVPEGRRRRYQLTEAGERRLEEEVQRLLRQVEDYRQAAEEEGEG